MELQITEKLPLRLIDDEYRYGFHVKKYPSMLKTVSEAWKYPLTAIQVYISSARSKCPPFFDYTDLFETRKFIERCNLHVVIHGCLLYNLAGTTNGEKDDNYHSALASTLQGLTAELDFGVMIKAGVVVHPGSQKNTKVGILKIAESIEEVLTRKTVESARIAKLLNVSQSDVIKMRKIILENAAGEGTKICSTLEEIASVIQAVRQDLRPQIKVCIDTAHAFGKGIYDWGKKGEIKRFYKDFERIVGMEYLEMFHFNDSMKSDKKANNAPFGSKRDRHEQLGDGYIFGSTERLKCVKTFMRHARLNKIIVIGEPPKSGELDFILIGKLLADTEYPLIKIMNF
jgi:apurinic endonuclease APN1